MLFAQDKPSLLTIRRCMYCNRVYGFYRGKIEINLKQPVAGHLTAKNESTGICPVHAYIAIAAALQGIDDFFSPLSPA